MIVARKRQPRRGFHDREDFCPGKRGRTLRDHGRRPECLNIKSGITGYSGLGLRDRLGRERHTQLIAIRVAADDALARGDDADQ